MSKVILRNIHFYKLASSNVSDDRYADKVDIQEIFNTLISIETDMSNNFLSIDDEHDLAIWIVNEQFPFMLIFGKIRKKGFPRLVNGLKIRDLNLARNTGLVEMSHMIFWDNGIVGVEYNHYGPKVSKFEEYIKDKTSKSIHLHQIVNRNIDEIFNKIQGIFSFKIKFYSSYLEDLSQEDSDLITGLSHIKRYAQSDIITLEAKNKKRTDRNYFFQRKIFNFMKTIAIKRNSLRALAGAKIEGEYHEGDQFQKNLLEDLFVYTKKIIALNKSKAVESTDMFNKIREVYQENQNELIRSGKILFEYYE